MRWDQLAASCLSDPRASAMSIWTTLEEKTFSRCPLACFLLEASCEGPRHEDRLLAWRLLS